MTQEFYILAVSDDEHQFVKVVAELVDIGFSIPAFAYNSGGRCKPLEFWNVFDLVSGWRLCKAYAQKSEAVGTVKQRVAEVGLDVYMKQQKVKLDEYGKSPAVEG